jgi:hypothetical protein
MMLPTGCEVFDLRTVTGWYALQFRPNLIPFQTRLAHNGRVLSDIILLIAFSE